MLETSPFDLLICDLKMPKTDGFQVLETVQRKYPQLRTMALTINTNEKFRSHSNAMGVDLFCEKPCREEECKMWLKEVASLLERQPPASREPAVPAVKSVPTGMAADKFPGAKTRHAVKPVLNVLLGFGSGERFRFFAEAVRAKVGQHYDLRLSYCEEVSDFSAMALQQPCDLAIVLNANWPDAGTWLEIVATQCHIPIIVPQQFDPELAKRLEAAGVYSIPNTHSYFSTFDFWNVLVDCLNIPRSSPTPQPGHKRPLRIVITDDEPFVLDALKMALKLVVHDATILSFDSAKEALVESGRQEPDLFTTDYMHPGITGAETLQTLAARKVKHPVFVISACEPEEEVLLFAGPDLDVTLLRKPFLLADFRHLMSIHFGLGDHTYTLAAQTRTAGQADTTKPG